MSSILARGVTRAVGRGIGSALGRWLRGLFARGAGKQLAEQAAKEGAELAAKSLAERAALEAVEQAARGEATGAARYIVSLYGSSAGKMTPKTMWAIVQQSVPKAAEDLVQHYTSEGAAKAVLAEAVKREAAQQAAREAALRRAFMVIGGLEAGSMGAELAMPEDVNKRLGLPALGVSGQLIRAMRGKEPVGGLGHLAGVGLSFLAAGVPYGWVYPATMFVLPEVLHMSYGGYRGLEQGGVGGELSRGGVPVEFVVPKPEGVSDEQWDSLSQEEKVNALLMNMAMEQMAIDAAARRAYMRLLEQEWERRMMEMERQGMMPDVYGIISGGF